MRSAFSFEQPGDEPLRRCYAPSRTVERVMPPARLLAALAVCAIALAACGSSSKPSTSRSADTQALKYADCMRANGMPNFPDPGSNGALPTHSPTRPRRRSERPRQPVRSCSRSACTCTAPPSRQPPNCAPRSRSPDACATRGLALPGSAHDRIGCGDPDTRPGGVLSRPRPDRGLPLAGVQAGSQGLRTAASRRPAVAIPADQQEALDLRLAPAGGPRDISELYAGGRTRPVGRPKDCLASHRDPRRRHHNTTPRAMRERRGRGQRAWSSQARPAPTTSPRHAFVFGRASRRRRCASRSDTRSLQQADRA